ncbi:type IV secretion protein DotO [Tahibacter amnicola]|uniref:Type IV secretion protein DotO n=1 Tax=Tahibacter amnicola TaxID=2976241 RepID=A0ABY6BGY0_9GAMM|nr:type IV secretion protein DotO [Tahibacter amnicola]UXI68330.1 type IV secretion protein DotO [Tahibacter amnicola]
MSATSKLEAVLLHVIGKLKTSIRDYCDLETIDGGRCLVANDGSLASIIQFHGTKSVLGRDQYTRLIQLMETSLSVYFANRGHQLQVVFRRDLDARTTLEGIALQQRQSADRVGLSVHDLIDENVQKYSAYVYDEDCWLVCWTRPALLDPVEHRLSRDAVNDFRKASNWPAMANGQNLLRPIAQLRDRHLAFVTKVCDDLGTPEFGCSAELLSVEAALRSIRYCAYPDITNPDWTPAIPGTKIPFRWKTNEDMADLSEVLYPSLPDQIMVAGAEIGQAKKGSLLPDPCTIRVGSRVYAPLVVAIPPREPEFFNDLFHALNRAETVERGVTRAVPYCISFMLEGDGMSVMMFKSIFSNILAFTSESNRNINLATRELNEYRRDGGKVVKLRIAAMTWSGISPDEVKELTLRKNKLWRAIEGWGNPVVIERTGDAMLAFQSNCLGLTTKHIGDPCPAPLGDAIKLLPLTRPASPFASGSTVYRSLDGKILRYQRFSSEQTTWITLISGKPGSGKSVLMNSNNFESCIMPGATRLPFICIIDIGVSSSGFIDLVKDSLREDQKHLAIYKRLQNAQRDAINPLDTSLGLREPLQRDRDFAKNFVTILVTPPERQGLPYEGMSNFVGRVIDVTYRKKSDAYEKSQPETYKPGHDRMLDAAVAQLPIKVRPATTYWELVDALFAAGMHYEAEVAQRYAVPVLNDLVQTAASEEIRSEYGEMTVQGGLSIINAFMVGIREAVGDFPIFSSHTQFDIGPSRVMALDLQDVAVQGSDSAKKQTSLMYMIARQSFMKKVAYSKEDLPAFTGAYRHHFERLIGEITDEYKVMCMDEFHKTGGHAGLKLQLTTDGREARKWNLELVLASQLMEDFGELTKIATSFFMMDSGTEQTREWLRKNIGLNEVEERALVGYVHGAGRHGATFLARFLTKSAAFTQLFTMTAGPMRLWALSTTAEDRRLRSMLYDVMPKPVARRLLAEQFPSGSCKAMVERLKTEQFKSGTFVDDDMTGSLVERIGKELIETYYQRGLNEAA